jgi:uncharacterized coiled-coil protein SlyX
VEEQVPDSKLTTSERLVRLETVVAHADKEITTNGMLAKEGLKILADKLDELDKKWDQKFNELRQAQIDDQKELEKIKNRGAGVLAGLGVLFTATATVFSDFFSSLKHAILG